MTINRETEPAASTNNISSGTSSSLAPLGSEQDTLDLELQAAASEIESLAVQFEDVNVEVPDQFIMVVFPNEDPKQEEEEKVGEKEEEKEPAPLQKTWKDLLMGFLPVCPPPVCEVLKEELITLTIMVIIGLLFFLIYWCVE